MVYFDVPEAVTKGHRFGYIQNLIFCKYPEKFVLAGNKKTWAKLAGVRNSLAKIIDP